MQEAIFYVAAGVSALLRMRLFARRDGLEPYPLEVLEGIVRWQWAMDTDFNEATAYMLQADNAYIEAPEVTDDIDVDEYTSTELSIPMPQMNTAELAEWIGTDRSRNGLHGEPVVSQAQETLEELVGYRLGKRKRRPRRPEGCFGGSRHCVRYPDNFRGIFSSNSLPFWIYLPSPEAPQ